MLTLGGSVVTTTIPPSFVNLQNPNQVQPSPSLNALAMYYNTTLSQIGSRNFENASFLLSTFRFVNIPSSVNGTAQLANVDLGTVNLASANATEDFANAESEIQARQYVNASTFVGKGCSMAMAANRTMADFQGPQTIRFESESVPVGLYSKGSLAASAEVGSLLATCGSLSQRHTSPGLVLLIGSPHEQAETGGTVRLDGNLTLNTSGIPDQVVLFYINGSYFGSLVTSPEGLLSGTLQIPFIYSNAAAVEALAEANSTRGTGGTTSNTILFTILFNRTSLAVADPPAYLPGSTFSVHGNLTTVNGLPLPDAPITVTYLRDSVVTSTDSLGTFRAQFMVPGNATDGTYYIYARFSPRGAYGPSFNFTSIVVYHLRLILTLSLPGLSLAGFSTHISGTATSNGTAVPNANITLDSPWGASTATTDQEGHFDIVFSVSPLEFALSKNVTVSASPSEPYIASSTVVATLGLFNILLVILPATIIGVAAYEANSLGVFQDLRVRLRARNRETLSLSTLEKPSIETLPPADRGPEPLRLFGRALILASTRFLIEFRPSQTIREMQSLVKAKDDGEAFVAFSRVLLTAEDFLYGKKFDSLRTDDARKALATLEVLWA